MGHQRNPCSRSEQRRVAKNAGAGDARVRLLPRAGGPLLGVQLAARAIAFQLDVPEEYQHAPACRGER